MCIQGVQVLIQMSCQMFVVVFGYPPGVLMVPFCNDLHSSYPLPPAIGWDWCPQHSRGALLTCELCQFGEDSWVVSAYLLINEWWSSRHLFTCHGLIVPLCCWIVRAIWTLVLGKDSAEHDEILMMLPFRKYNGVVWKDHVCEKLALFLTRIKSRRINHTCPEK